MRKNKVKNTNGIQMIAFIISAFSLIVALFTITFDSQRFDTGNMALMMFTAVFAACISFAYSLLITRRINPIKYIYLSYSSVDEEMALSIAKVLDEQLKKLSKYRFEILSVETVPYGSDLKKTMAEYLDKSSLVIVIVSEGYVSSKRCNNEFHSIKVKSKKMIPVVKDSYDILSELSVWTAGIKALSLKECKSEEELEQRIVLLAKDLIRQRQEEA